MRARWVYGVWMTVYVSPGGTVVAWFNGGGIARMWYGPPIEDIAEGTRYDKYVWEKLAPLRLMVPGSLRGVDRYTYFVF